MPRLLLACLLVLLALPVGAAVTSRPYALPSGGGFPHDVAVSADGVVWYTAQRDGKLGRLDPASGTVELVALGQGAAPHGVIIGPDGAPWVTEGGTNSIVRVDPKTREVKRWPLPETRKWANLNTATFDKRGRIWFTGQSGIYGRLDPATGDSPRAYAVYVDEHDVVWLSEWSANAMVRFEPATEKFQVFPSDKRGANVRQILGRPGEVWAPESGNDRLVVYRTQ